MAYQDDYFQEVYLDTVRILFPDFTTVFDATRVNKVIFEYGIFGSRFQYKSDYIPYEYGENLGLDNIMRYSFGEIENRRNLVFFFDDLDQDDISFARVISRINKTIYPQISTTHSGKKKRF